MKPVIDALTCNGALSLISPFIDSAVTADEADRFRQHLAECAACHRQLQSFISLRNVLAAAEPIAIPEDLQLETRVRLSNVRARNERDRWQARLDNTLKPAAVPAVTGVTIALLFVLIIFGGLLTPRTVVFAKTTSEGPSVGLYEPPETTTPTLKRFGAEFSPDLDQAISVQTEVSDTGRVYDYSIIGGTRSAGVDRWLQQQLLLAQFRPATSWGIPVPSRMILSFINVRG